MLKSNDRRRKNRLGSLLRQRRNDLLRSSERRKRNRLALLLKQRKLD